MTATTDPNTPAVRPSPTPQLVLDGAPGWCLQGGEVLTIDQPQWPVGHWLVADLEHHGPTMARIEIRFFAKDDPHQWRFYAVLGYMPKCRVVFAIDSAWLAAQSVFFARTPGRLKATCFGRRIETEAIQRIEIQLQENQWPQETVLGAIRLQAQVPEFVVRGPVMSDQFGQRADCEWPGKIHIEAELVQTVETAESAMVPPPQAFNRWGGWAQGQRQELATGFFRTHRDEQSRWWLVDPDGHLFFSVGLDCVRPAVDASVVPGTESLYGWLPTAEDPQWSGICSINGHGLPQVDYGMANLIRVFGPQWRQRWRRLSAQRIRQWGFNTIGNWSDIEIGREFAIPYVMPMGKYPSTERTLFRDLPDVFDPVFEQQAAAWAQMLKPCVGDPAFIGYFLANEPHWAFGTYNLAVEMMESFPGSYSRQAFVKFLQQRYENDEPAFNAAWAGAVNGFSALEHQCLHRAETISEQAAADCAAFSRILAERFVRIPAAAARAVAPMHLCLGLRWAWISSDLCFAGAECCDVFTINCYQFAPPDNILAQIAAAVDLPVMIGEFHFGTIDRGLPSTGLKAVSTQVDRGIAYRHFMEAAAAHPQLVGAHYFTLNDQHCLGRFDGENYQIGLVDVTQRPYQELLAAARASHDVIYDVAAGQRPPQAETAPEATRIAF